MPHPAPLPRHPAAVPPRRTGDARGAFSLVLSLTVMAMLLILCVGAAALLAMELRVAQASVSVSKARLNAMVGARIALGELQRLVGPDQRVTASADILGDPNATDPTQSAAYQSTGRGMIVHPRWVGVWNTGGTDDDNAPIGAVSAQSKKLIYRTDEGGLRDSRYVNNATGAAGADDWTRDRAGVTMAAGTKRLLGWLVSGGEALPRTDTTAPTPFTPVSADNDVVILGRDTLGSLFNPSRTDTDLLGARARIVTIADTAQNAAGSYAYWVADEGLKARINIRDKFEAAGIAPNASNPSNGGYARLLVSQRGAVGPTATVSPIPGAPPLPEIAYASGKAWDKITSFDSLTLVNNPSATGVDYRSYYFHDLSFVSEGVACDVENGGLKKDLTAYLNNAGSDIPDFGGVRASGIRGARALLPVSDPSSGETAPVITPVFPTFSLLARWWADAPTFSGTNGTEGVATVATTTTSAAYIQKTSVNGSSPGDPVFNVQVPVANAVTVAPRSPLVTQMTMHFKIVYDDTTPPPGGNYQNRILVYPQIVLWNPYSVPLKLENPTVEWLNDWCVYANITGTPSTGSVTYIATRPHLTYRLPSITIRPGQSVSFVADPAANPFPVSGTVMPNDAFNARTVTMKAGLPGPGNYYLDAMSASGWGTALVKAPTPTPPIAGVSVGYCTGNFNPATFDERTMSTDQVILRDGANSLVHLKLDRHNTSSANMIVTDGRHYATKPLTDQWGAGVYLRTLNEETASPTAVSPSFMVGFRAKRLDESEQADTGAGGRRGLTVNPFVDMNIRAARQTRSPFDAQDMITPLSSGSKRTNLTLNFTYIGQYLGGIWTEDWLAAQDMAGISPASATSLVPFYNASRASGGAYPGCVLFDTPYRDIGLLSIGSLDSAPLNLFGYGPAMPFGSGRIPVADTARLTASTVVPAAEATTMWSAIAQWGSTGQEAMRQVSRIGAATSDIMDTGYELNHAIWDGYRMSGIPAANTGWQVASGAWLDQAPSGDLSRTLPDSRYTPATGAFPAATGFFNSSTYGLYHASYTLMQKGAFNVNSTSRVAWMSLLASTRGLSVPTMNGMSPNPNLTPFLRLLRPKGGRAESAAPFSENVWSGYRALSDEEIRTLADKIVAEVKKRGPFMSLSDFVNRRLKTPSAADYSNWTQRECDYLGTLEAAITNAGINAGFDAGALMDRSTKDTFVNTPRLARQTQTKPEHRARHMVAGTPGYLQQSDILRSVGSALTARSDTFTVRSRGESGGAVAWVEITVQRSPEPVVPGSAGALPVNPKAVAPGSPYAGNQFFGRRMRIVATRWIDNPTA